MNFKKWKSNTWLAPDSFGGLTEFLWQGSNGGQLDVVVDAYCCTTDEYASLDKVHTQKVIVIIIPIPCPKPAQNVKKIGSTEQYLEFRRVNESKKKNNKTV